MDDAASRDTGRAEKPTLTDRLRARTSFLTDPVVGLLANWGVSPNILTVSGTVAHLIPAWLVATGMIRLAAVGLILIAPLDALDGALSRKQGRQQKGFGAFLDSTLDRVAEIILFGGFVIYYGSIEDALMVGAVYLAIGGSLMVSYARARAEALGISCKVGVLSRVERYLVLTAGMILGLPDYAMLVVALFAWITVAQRVLHVWQQAQTKKESL